MFGARSILLSLTLLLAASLLGCGSSFVPVLPAASTSNLNGNWLLAGIMPTSGAFTDSAFSVTGIFDVVGNQVSGIVLPQIPCTPGVISVATPVGVAVSGTIASDGTFTLTTPESLSLGQTMTLKGQVPSASGGTWVGSYRYTDLSLTNGCPNATGSISAASIAPVAGSYTGSALLADQATLELSPVTVSVSLQQGDYVASTPVVGFAGAHLSLSGTISVSSSPCLTTGTLSPVTATLPSPGVILGSLVDANFLMNDGTVVQMSGQIAKEDASVLLVGLYTSVVGTCGKTLTWQQPGDVTLSH